MRKLQKQILATASPRPHAGRGDRVRDDKLLAPYLLWDGKYRLLPVGGDTLIERAIEEWGKRVDHRDPESILASDHVSR